MDMYIGIASKLLIGASGIFIMMRILGKKTISDISPFDLIYGVLLGSIVEESIYDDNVNVLHVLFAIFIWGVFVYFVERAIQHTERLSSHIQGEPSVLIDKGKLNRKELEENFFDMEQLRSALRQNDVYSISDVYYAILEVNGNVNIITKEKSTMPTFLVVELGHIQKATLNGLGKTEEWLRTELVELGYDDIENIIYCEWDPNEGNLIVETYENTINEKIYIDD